MLYPAMPPIIIELPSFASVEALSLLLQITVAFLGAGLALWFSSRATMKIQAEEHTHDIEVRKQAGEEQRKHDRELAAKERQHDIEARKQAFLYEREMTLVSLRLERLERATIIVYWQNQVFLSSQTCWENMIKSGEEREPKILADAFPDLSNDQQWQGELLSLLTFALQNEADVVDEWAVAHTVCYRICQNMHYFAIAISHDPNAKPPNNIEDLKRASRDLRPLLKTLKGKLKVLGGELVVMPPDLDSDHDSPDDPQDD